jgi:hypothetical protein
VTPQVGIFPPVFDRDPGELRRFLARAADAGLDHVAVGDHVSFWVGAGRDGLVDATAMAMLHPALPVHVAVHLLAMRQGGSSRALSMQRETCGRSRSAPSCIAGQRLQGWLDSAGFGGSWYGRRPAERPDFGGVNVDITTRAKFRHLFELLA